MTPADLMERLPPVAQRYLDGRVLDEVECIVADGEAPKYPPITAGRHLMAKFRSTVI